MTPARESDQGEGRQNITREHAPARGRFYYGWVIVGVCFLVMTLVAPVLASFSIFYVAILEDLKWTRGDTALAMSIYLVVGGLMAPFSGGLIDRFGPKRAMPAGAVIVACALLMMSQMTAQWQFYIAYGVVAAMGGAMLHIVPLTTIVSNWFVRNRGLAIGLVTAGQGVGQVAAPLVQVLINRAGWRGAYLVLSAMILLVPTTLVLLFLYKKPADKGLSPEDEAGLRGGADAASLKEAGNASKREVVIIDKQWAETEWSVGKAVRTFRLWSLMLVMAMFAAGFLMISVQLVAYLTDEGYSPVLAASVVGLQGFVNIIGRFAGGWLSDRIGREKTLTLSVASFVVCLLLLKTAGVVTITFIPYLFAIFYGMGSGMTLPVLMAAAADLFQGKHFGSILGVITLGGFTGGALGAWLGGYFFDLTKAYNMNFLVATVVMLISAALIWKARPSRVRIVRAVQAA
jgi:MFS family permease